MATHGITADQARTTFRQRLTEQLAETAVTAEQLARQIITEHTPLDHRTDPTDTEDS